MKQPILRGLISSGFVLLAFCGAAGQQPTSTPAMGWTPVAREAPLFDFHSNFLVNLHQTLFHEALLKRGAPDRRLQSTSPLPDTDLTAAEKHAWNAAVDFYGKEFEGKRVLFDDELVRINGLLSREPDGATAPDLPGLPQDLTAVLRDAGPVYAKHWWPAHDRSNREWIASMTPLVSAMGSRIASAMQRDLQQSWPAAPLRVDASFFVPEIGHAYTTDDPPHTTYSTSASALEGLNGFETLFHEASHAFADTMSNALFDDCGTAKKNCGDLWHAVLFYTAGVETRRALPTADQANFTPYAYQNGLYDRGDFPKYRRVLEKSWQPYLDGKTDFQSALREMVARL